MSKKQDNSSLIAQLEELNNKELREKCLEYGMNVPVADSSRDVIIRKLVKSITGASSVAPKASGKVVNVTASPGGRRKTVNVTVHLSDEEDETQRPRGANRNNKVIAQAKASTQSSKHAKSDVNRRTIATASDFGKSNIASDAVSSPTQYESGINNNTKHIESGTIIEGSATIKNNLESNFNQGYDGNRIINSRYHGSSPTLSNSNEDRHQFLGGTNFSAQTKTPVNYQEHQQNIFAVTPQQTYGYSRPIGFGGGIENTFSQENNASHSSTLTGASKRNVFSGLTPSPETVFKRPATLTKTTVTTNSYNQEDAQRLYPRLPTDINSRYISSSAETTPEQYLSRNERAPSLSKSGVLTTSYHQELTPPSEVKHKDVEYEDSNANAFNSYEYDDIERTDRGKYLSTAQRNTEQIPFGSRLQSTFLNNSSAPTRYSEALTKSRVSSKPLAYSGTNYTTTHHNLSTRTNYTNSVDEPDSPSEDEASSAQESEVEGYVPGAKKIYSSFGSNNFQERVPYRRSNYGIASPGTATQYNAFNESPITARRHTLSDDDDDVNATFLNFIQTLDRKYHIKQWIYMFLLFIAAVFVYVFFVQSDENDTSIHLDKKNK